MGVHTVQTGMAGTGGTLIEILMRQDDHLPGKGFTLDAFYGLPFLDAIASQESALSLTHSVTHSVTR